MNNEKHIFGVETIPQFHIMSHILDIHGITSEYDLLNTKEIKLLSRNRIALVNKSDNQKTIFTYNEETKEITKEDVL